MAVGARHVTFFEIGQGAILLAAGLAIGLGASFICVPVFRFVVWSQRHRSVDIYDYSRASVAGALLASLCSPAARDKVDPLEDTHRHHCELFSHRTTNERASFHSFVFGRKGT
jgi:hypothetical protein